MDNIDPKQNSTQVALQEQLTIPIAFIANWMKQFATNSDIKVMFEAMLEDYRKEKDGSDLYTV